MGDKYEKISIPDDAFATIFRFACQQMMANVRQEKKGGQDNGCKHEFFMKIILPGLYDIKSCSQKEGHHGVQNGIYPGKNMDVESGIEFQLDFLQYHDC
jgi:hypothetical protein